MLAKFNRCCELEEKYIHTDNDGSYFVEKNGDTLDVYFEWSNGLIDWLHNFYFPAKPYRDMKNLWFCHRGFLKVWKSIEPHIICDLMDPDIKTINIVGYSHGAAIAQLCYEYVKFYRPDISVSGIGFGAPRVFWGFARKAVRERFKGFVVVRNGCDIVTHLPPVFFGFRHICDVVKLKHGKSKGLIEDHLEQNYRESLANILRVPDHIAKRLDNTCIYCGAVIPEGRLFCPMCEENTNET